MIFSDRVAVLRWVNDTWDERQLHECRQRLLTGLESIHEGAEFARDVAARAVEAQARGHMVLDWVETWYVGWSQAGVDPAGYREPGDAIGVAQLREADFVEVVIEAITLPLPLPGGHTRGA